MELANTVTWTMGMTLDETEELIIKKALHCNGNNKTKTALALGVAIRTIDNKLDTYKKRDAELEKTAESEEAKAKRDYEERLHIMKKGRREGVTTLPKEKEDDKRA